MADLAKVNADVMKSAGEIFRLCQEWNKLSKEMQQETASTMVQHFKDLSDNFRIMLENDPNGSKESTKPIQDLGNHLMDILNIVSSSEVPETVTIDSVSESCLAVVTVLNDESRRKQALDDIDLEVSNLAIDLDTSIMFLDAGILIEQDTVQPFADHRDKLLSKSTMLVDGIKSILSNFSSKDAIVTSAQTCAKTLQEIVQEVKGGSASLGSQFQEAQASLLNTTKVVVNSFRDLLKQARKMGSDQTELEELGASAKTVVGNVTSLLRCVKTAEDTHGRSEAATEAAIEAIGREIVQLHIEEDQKKTGEESTPEDLVAATRAVTEAVAGLDLHTFRISQYNQHSEDNRCRFGVRFRRKPRPSCCRSQLGQEGRQ